MTRDNQPELQPFHAMEVLAAAQRLEAEGRRIIHMELGEPAAPAAPEVRQAVRAGLDEPQRYSNAKGTPALRKALAGYYRTQHRVEVDPNRIFATLGSSSGFILTFLAGFEPGARIALTRPGYPAYFNIIRSLGFRVVEIEISAETGWQLSAAQVSAAFAVEPFDGLLFASPANPTGAVAPRQEFADLIAVSAELGIRFISDEIYHGLEFEGDPASALEFTSDAIIINSFSKFYCMTGWRIGWMVLPENLCRKAEMLAQSLFISPSSLGQVAGLAALGARQYGEAQRAHNRTNRDIFIKGLKKLGFEGVREPDGAFYAYVDVSQFGLNSQDFCMRLLQEAGVAATPGIDFDQVNGGNYVRFSFAGPREDVELAINKMGDFVSRPF